MKSKTGLLIVFLFVWAVFLFAINIGSAYALEKVKLGLCSSTTPGTCVEVTADLFKTFVEQRSHGSIEITRYGAGELYRDKEAFSALSEGAIEMAALSGPLAGMRSRALEFIAIFGAVGMWDSIHHYNRFLDNPETRKIVSDEMRKQYNAEFLAPFAYGLGIVGSRRPIHTVEDYKNLKLRTVGGAMATCYKSVGAIPTDLSSSEQYMALQRGLVDAACSGPARFLKSSIYEVTPYLIYDGILPAANHFLAINTDVWNKLSPEHQKILQETASYVTPWSRGFGAKESEEALNVLKSKKEVKEVYFLPKEEREKMTKIVKPAMVEYVYNRIGKEMGAKLLGLLESAR